jgi:hypothetical protein
MSRHMTARPVCAPDGWAPRASTQALGRVLASSCGVRTVYFNLPVCRAVQECVQMVPSRHWAPSKNDSARAITPYLTRAK